MAEDAYDLSGPFAEGIKNLDASRLTTFGVTISPEKSSIHPLNAVGQLKRLTTLSNPNNGPTEALLSLSLQFLEIFTIVREMGPGRTSQEGGRHTGKFARKLKTVASSGAGHVLQPLHRLRNRDNAEDPGPAEVEDVDAEVQEKYESILKDHCLSISVTLQQIIKMRMSGTTITVYFHPNGMSSTRYSKLLKGAMRLTFCTETQQDANRLMEAAQNRINRINQAAVFLRTDMVLPSSMHIFAVTRPIAAAQANSEKDEELVVAKDAPWGIAVPAPPCWGPKASNSKQQLYVYMSTPLGYGKAEVTPATVAKYQKNGHAAFYVGVRHPQAQPLAVGTVSRLQRVDTRAREHEDEMDADDDDDDSDESWQPDSASSENGSSVDNESSLMPRLSRLSRAANAGKITSTNGRNGQHIRLHCSATYIDGPASAKAAISAADSNSAPVAASSVSSGPLPQFLVDKQRDIMLALLALTVLTFAASRFGLTSAAGVLQTFFLLPCLGLALYGLTARQPAQAPNPPSLRTSVSSLDRQKALGTWKITLVRAEVMRDEPWSEDGSSVVGKIGEDDSEEAIDNRKSDVANEFGFSKDVVDRYILGFNNDEAVAHSKMAASHAWREKNGCIDILHQPAPNFKFFKNMFHHALLGTTKDGHPVWFMKIGDMKTGFKTYKQSQMTSKDLARHVALCLDYLYEVTETAPLPNGRALWILDLKGMGLTDMGGEAFDLGKEIAGLISAHWPERLYRAFIINMPGFFSVLWKLIEPMMAATTRRKIRLLRGKENMVKEMTEEMSIEDIPIEYGGKLDDVYHAKKEKEFWSFVESQGK